MDGCNDRSSVMVEFLRPRVAAHWGTKVKSCTELCRDTGCKGLRFSAWCETSKGCLRGVLHCKGHPSSTLETVYLAAPATRPQHPTPHSSPSPHSSRQRFAYKRASRPPLD